RVSLFEDAGRTLAMSMVRDITERKKAEEEIQRSEQKFRSIFDRANDGMVLANPETKMFYEGNRAFGRMLGYDIAEINTLGVADIHPKKDLPFVVEQFERQAKGEFEVAQNIPVQTKDGSVLYADISSTPMVIGGETRVLGIFRDVTKELAVERTKNDFIEIASHQLRTPLTGIRWVMERLLKTEQLSLQAKEYMQDVLVSSARLGELVRVRLNVSRLEGGMVSVKVVSLDAAKAVRDFLTENTMLFTQKQLSLATAGLDAPLPVKTDVVMLSNIIQALVSNAIEYTPPKGAIRVALSKKENNFLLEVADNGIGIPAEVQHRLFEKFFRAENARLVKPGGTGLGLYITKQAATLLGGKVWFEPGKKGGTVFYVELPLQSKPREEGKSLI
ncbi:MAG: PAS domain-containing sensor histidine kinase, partial [Patescibacteria group bacterium]